MSQNSIVIFVCEHGAAKSIIAAAYFNKLAIDKGLELRAIARGTNPDNELSANTIAGLHEDGLMPAQNVPQKLSIEDMKSAQRIISFCELPEEYQRKMAIERWDNIPPVSENYEKARAAILERLNQLMQQLR